MSKTSLCRTSLAAALALLLAGTMAQAAGPERDWSGDGGVSDFYRWEQRIPATPGTPLRHEAAPTPPLLPQAASAERLLYTSTGSADGAGAVTVSGVVYLPQGEAPAGGWPIVAWAHGTTGVADVCAPSWKGRAADRWKYLDSWLGAGFAVVATDYRGLGTPGTHPYLLWRPEGYDVLDSVRAARRQWPDTLANQVIIIGQSQGGGAALGATYLAPDYAPEVKVIGTVATGPAMQIADAEGARQLELPRLGSDDSPVNAAFEALFVLGTMRGAEPRIDPADWVSDAGMPLLEKSLHACFHDVIDLAVAEGVNFSSFYKRDITALDALQRQEGFLPNGHIVTPVFLGTGLQDDAVDPRQQYNVVSSMCHAGAAVEWHTYPGESHISTVNASLVDSLPFAQRVLAGEAAPGNCAALTPPRMTP